MKIYMLIFWILLCLDLEAVTTFSGHIGIKKTSISEIEVTYTFIVDQMDSVITADSIQSQLHCQDGTAVDLVGLYETRRTKQYLNCSKRLYKWKLEYSTNIDLAETRYTRFQNCCNLRITASCGQRSMDITTLTNPKQPFFVYTEFENCRVAQNSTASLSDFNFNTNCGNQGYFLNVGMADIIDFDSLSYELSTPMLGNNLTANFNSKLYADQPLTPFYPLGKDYPDYDFQNDPPIGFYMDSKTGDCYYTPIFVIEKGPIVWKVSEWRKNNKDKYEKISTTLMERFVSTNLCPENNPPEIIALDEHYIQPNKEFCLKIYSDDKVNVPLPPATPPAPDRVVLTWDRGISEGTFTIINSGDRLETAKFCWTPKIEDASFLAHTFTITARDNFCPLNATTKKRFKIYVTEETESIIENDKKEITFYPNPTSDYIQLSQEFESIEIMTQTGETVLKKKAIKIIEVSNLTPGEYYIKGRISDSVLNGKFIKIN